MLLLRNSVQMCLAAKHSETNHTLVQILLWEGQQAAQPVCGGGWKGWSWGFPVSDLQNPKGALFICWGLDAQLGRI